MSIKDKLQAAEIDPENPGNGKKKKKSQPSAADLLARLATEQLDLWHDDSQTGYASRGRRSFRVRSREFRLWLIGEFRRNFKGKVPNAEAVANATTAVEAAAIYDGPTREVHVRIAPCGDRAFLYLADAEDTVIEVDAKGWRPCDAPPVRFRRPPGQIALPMPVRGGHLDDLRKHLNCPDDSAFALVKAWTTAAFTRGPYPALVLSGEHGSAKSTTSKILKTLIDPSSASNRCEPKEVRDLMIAGRGSWVLAIDNISFLHSWLSDALCRLATGGGFSTRTLYTDDEEMIFEAKRPVILNGIEDFVSRPDLLDRSILIRHPGIPDDQRKREEQVLADFAAEHGRILGGILSRVSAGFRELPRVRLPRLPRMADFAMFSVACEQADDADGASPFVSSYEENRAGAQETALEDSVIAGSILKLLEGVGSWSGTATDLLAQITPDPIPKDFPRKPNALTGRLRRIAPALREVHRLTVEFEKQGKNRNRTIAIKRRPDESGKPSSAPSAPSATPRFPGKSADGGRTVAPEADDKRAVARNGTVRTQGRLGSSVTPTADGADDGSSRVSGAPSGPDLSVLFH